MLPDHGIMLGLQGEVSVAVQDFLVGFQKLFREKVYLAEIALDLFGGFYLCHDLLQFSVELF